MAARVLARRAGRVRGGPREGRHNQPMDEIDWTRVSADDKESLLGREFRNLTVRSFKVSNGVMFTVVILEGREVTLVGDPCEALKVYLGGQPPTPETLQ